MATDLPLTSWLKLLTGHVPITGPMSHSKCAQQQKSSQLESRDIRRPWGGCVLSPAPGLSITGDDATPEFLAAHGTETDHLVSIQRDWSEVSERESSL